MRWPFAWWATWLVLVAAGPSRGDPGKDAHAERIAALIQQLGDRAFAKREAAGKELEALGEKTLPALRHAAAAADLETRSRATRLIRTVMLGSRTSKSTGLEMALVDAGEFRMGSPANESYRRPDEQQHRVRITRSFLIGAYEVTQDEYTRVMGTNPSWFAPMGLGGDRVARENVKRFPVETVTWFDAVEFCIRLSQRDGYEPAYTLAEVIREGGSIRAARVAPAGGNGYRLPTEAEWEYACRAMTIRAFHFGTQNAGTQANLKPGPATGYGVSPTGQALGRSAKVGSYPANPWGLYDMHGNVGEWCWDWYDKDYYAASPADDPQGPSAGTHRAVRGGSWLVNEGSCRAASRFLLPPGESCNYVGFRVVRVP